VPDLRALALALLIATSMSCISAAKLPAAHKRLTADLADADSNKWAKDCGPAQLARARTHKEFAELEFEKGNARRATEHLDIARANIDEALACRPQDRDGDEIFDDVDQCPDEPEDYDDHLDTDGCPDYDRDKDGVEDDQDLCPDEPEDRDEFQDEDGCPDTDNDNDGVLDVDDKCPDQPENRNGYMDEDGCPDNSPGNVEVTKDQIVIKEKVLFATGRAAIKTVSHGILNAVVMVLADYPQIKVRVEGHTDSVGSASTNKRLSAARAKSVRDYLIAKGVDAGRLTAKGMGEDRPIDTNRTRTGKANNRRVEFHITDGM
jgi:outer membrane protein OmpA-like peptidoglycan-associated protein